MTKTTNRKAKQKTAASSLRLSGQAVLVLQGGGALGAFQVGAYEALEAAGLKPDWVIGTSIGAINAAIICGNPPGRRIEQLHAFWNGLQAPATQTVPPFLAALGQGMANLNTIARGVPTFFEPSQQALLGPNAPVGIEQASMYSTAPLRATLERLVDLDVLNNGETRLTVGAVNARTGKMRYFDSRDEAISIDHIMASGALPPAFPAVRIDGEPYWDGGLYSNTPIEAVLEDNPRRNSVIFTINLWNPDGPEPRSVLEVMAREKDIQYASRASHHISKQQQIHHLRHIIRELAQHLPDKIAKSSAVSELRAWGCGTVMHVVPLVAPPREGEDQLKDIDFTPDGINTRMAAGRAEAERVIGAAPWNDPVDEREGIILHGEA